MNTIDASTNRARDLRTQTVRNLVVDAIASLRRRAQENNPLSGGLAARH